MMGEYKNIMNFYKNDWIDLLYKKNLAKYIKTINHLYEQTYIQIKLFKL